jgi:hypothetical protein
MGSFNRMMIKTLDLSNLQSISIFNSCKVPKLGHILRALKIFEIYIIKLKKADKVLQQIYSLYNMAKMIMHFEYLTQLHIKGFPYSSMHLLLEDPCFLLMSYEQLRNIKYKGASLFFVTTVSILAIKNMAHNIKFKKYEPRPLQQVLNFRKSNNAKIYGVSSSLDKILQHAIYLILYPLYVYKFRFEFYGFVNENSCHTILSSIYYEWLGIN